MADTRPYHSTTRRIFAVITAFAFTMFTFVIHDAWPDDDMTAATASPIVLVADWPGGAPDLTPPAVDVSPVLEMPHHVRHDVARTGREHVGLDVGVRRWRGIRSA